MMMSTQHHPTAELLTAFSAASLPLSQALCIAVHLEYCTECQIRLQSYEKLGGALFAKQQAEAASPSLRERTLAQITSTDTAISAPEQSRQKPVAEIPRCLHQFIPQDYQSLTWRRISLSIHSSELCRDSNGAKVELLRIKPGGAAATHTHLGDEFTVVLEGSFSDEEGLYRKGDFLARDASHQHTPIATRDRDCICLAVTEAPLQFTGVFSRLLNPLVRRSYG